MSEDSIRNEMDRIRREIAKFEKNRVTAMDKSGKDRRDATRINESIRSSTSPTTASSKRKQAERKLETAVREEKKAAELTKKMGVKQNRLSTLEKRLSVEIARKEKDIEKKWAATARTEERRAEKLIRDQDAADRRRRSREIQHERQLTSEARSRAQLFSSAVDPAALRSLPSAIKVLLVSSDPNDLAQLELAKEAREINLRIDRAKHRKAVKLVHALAAQPSDLIHELNKHRPKILHFSGHGSSNEGLAFRDDAGNTKLVSPEALATTIKVAADSVTLIVLNSCDSAAIASSLTDSVDIAIGMAGPINDESARIFSARLYGSIADGLSVARAFDQACAEMMLEEAPDFEIPTLFTRSRVDPDEIVLVRPPDEGLMGMAA